MVIFKLSWYCDSIHFFSGVIYINKMKLIKNLSKLTLNQISNLHYEYGIDIEILQRNGIPTPFTTIIEVIKK